MIYQAHRLVNWSPVLETAVSDIEVVYKDVEGELVSIRYGSLNDDEPHLIVATTRVETMLGDVAIAVHPDDERYKDLVGQEFAHPSARISSSRSSLMITWTWSSVPVP